MRLSSAQIFDSGTLGLQRTYNDLYKLQNQISTGRRILTPQDDPVAAAQALVTSDQQAVNNQYLDNQRTAKSTLALLESHVGGMTEILQDVREKWVAAGNGAYTPSERRAVATAIREDMQQLLALANTKDATGMAFFSGYKGGTQSFVDSNGTITYQGDGGRRQLQVSSQRFLDVSLSGQEVFESITQGNGRYVVNTDSANLTRVGHDAAAAGPFDNYDGNTYRVTIQNQGLDYRVEQIDTTTGLPMAPAVVAAATYTSGGAITVGGATITLTGTPVDNDNFTISPSTNQSVFTTINNFITALETGGTSDALRASYHNQLNQLGLNFDQALEHLSAQRSKLGSQLAELDNLVSLSQDVNVQYATQLSDLQDLDYVAAYSDLTKKKTSLDAAQTAFVKVTGLSLFDKL
ncbi:MAG: flagellar hook-associated protein 3 [Pseudomonadota bacterium]|jgi:flagellar hook-associated protein 3 FlgL